MITIDVRQSNQLTEQEIQLWREIARSHPSANHPFLQPEFIQTVGRSVPDTKVAVLTDNHQQVGFFPFSQRSPGAGYPVLHELTDYHGIVAVDDLKLNAIELINGCGLQTWHFDHVPADQAIFQPHHSCLDPCYVIQLDSGFDGYQQLLRERKSSVLSQALRKRRKLERDFGTVRFEIHVPTEQVIDNLVNWKKEHVNRRSPMNVFHQPWLKKFLLDMATQSSENFQPEVSTLYAGKRCIAIHFGLRTGTKLVSWIPTYHPEMSRYSPGQVLHAEVIQSAAQRDITQIELGRGANQLKLSLHTETYPMALGAVDSYLSSRAMRAGWYKAREVLNQHPAIRGRVRRIMQRIKPFRN